MDIDDLFTPTVYDAAASTSSMDATTEPGERQLDLVFILDCTGSMGSYIASATKNIELIVESILSSGKLASASALRIGLISYRDHPPQDNSYISKSFEFTSDVAQVKSDLKTLYASGGGDGCEAVASGMKAALELSWRPSGTSSKMVVLIADAPDHGIGEYGDGFPAGSPDGCDPLLIVRQMAALGITLFVVACEPALSGYLYGIDYFRALTVISSGLLVPLTTASLLSHVIVGSALEQMDMERLIAEVGQAVAHKVHSGLESVDDVALELHEKLLLRNEETRQLAFEIIHRDSEEARHNVNIFVQAPTLAEAKPHLKKVIGSRFTDKYQASRYSSYGSSRTPHVPVLPLRTSVAASASTATSPARRKVVSEFKPFAAATSLSMVETPLLGGGSESGTTTTATDGMEDVTQSVELRFQAISLDQAKRITQSAAWRSAPPRA